LHVIVVIEANASAPRGAKVEKLDNPRTTL